MKNGSIKKVLVIGSNPILIGQAAEFDYSSTQVCEALKEEGIEVVLINSNPATIMTDRKTADKTEYPVLVRPSYILGGQGMELYKKEMEIYEMNKEF